MNPTREGSALDRRAAVRLRVSGPQFHDGHQLRAVLLGATAQEAVLGFAGTRANGRAPKGTLSKGDEEGEVLCESEHDMAFVRNPD